MRFVQILPTHKVFDNQTSLTGEKSIDSYALESGIDEEAYKTCLKSDETKSAVSDDFSNGQKSGIQGTPGTIIVNTETNTIEVIPGALPLAESKKIIDSVL